MSMLRYSVTVQFDVEAGDPQTLQERLNDLESVGEIVNVKAKSAGKSAKDSEPVEA